MLLRQAYYSQCTCIAVTCFYNVLIHLLNKKTHVLGVKIHTQRTFSNCFFLTFFLNYYEKAILQSQNVAVFKLITVYCSQLLCPINTDYCLL